MALNFAAETEVDPRRSRDEIERILTKAGCTRIAIAVAPEGTMIAFEHGARRYRLVVRMPSLDHPYVTETKSGIARPSFQREAARLQLLRIRWRTLTLGIKARLAEAEVADEGAIQEVFLPYLVLPSGETVAEATKTSIHLTYQGRDVPLLSGAGR